VALVRTDVSEERSVSIIRTKTISELGTTLAVSRNFSHIPEDGILHTHRSENLESDTVVLCGRPISTFDEATASELYLYDKR
jgi:hypothetical protein